MLLLAAGVGGLFTACTTVPIPPPYTQDELKAICERLAAGGTPTA